MEVPPEEGKVRFADLPVAEDILYGIQTLGFKYCTPIQAQCLAPALEGKDVTGKALTGTGKTAAFLISSFTRLINNPIPAEQRKPGECRVLILAPTRELAMQIHKDAEKLSLYHNFHNLAVFGGMGHKSQRDELNHPVDILVGTPGRIIDYCSSGALKLEKTEILVIDEADRMLDMGFIPDVKRIVSRLPKVGERQTMFFSATLTDNINNLIKTWLKDPVQLETESESMVTDLIDQRFYAVPAADKFALLLWILEHENVERMIIFVNRKDVNSFLTRKLASYDVKCESLSGDVPQQKRIRILEDFRNGNIKIIVATDVAARGIHVDGVSHVVNYELPDKPEDYVHRIGRTGRAGNTGDSISFVCEYGAYSLPDIEEFMGHAPVCIQPEENMIHLDPPLRKMEPDRRRDSRPGGRSSSSGGGRSGGYKNRSGGSSRSRSGSSSGRSSGRR
jgi:ATP-dependent RNA helicase RhlB